MREDNRFERYLNTVILNYGLVIKEDKGEGIYPE